MLGLNKSIKNKSTLKDIILAECNNINDFDTIYSCTKELDTTNKLYGTGSIKFVKNGDIVGYFTADIEKAYNLLKYNSINLSIYTADKSNIASISITLFTTTPYSYDHAYIYFIGWQLVNGWNTFNIPFSEFTKYGSESLDTVKCIRITTNLTVDNQTETINLDRILFKL